MGSFSWLRADRTTRTMNVVYGTSFKFLIPKEFGGGYILDSYRDYGDLVDKKGNEYDMYEILAFWNREDLKNKELQFDDNTNMDMPIKSDATDHNRGIGINIGCYDHEIVKLKYPLKLVSPRYKGSYEDCNGPSLGDPNQGWGALTRKTTDSVFDTIKTYKDLKFTVEYPWGTPKSFTIDTLSKDGITDFTLLSVISSYALQYPSCHVLWNDGMSEILTKSQIDLWNDLGYLKIESTK